jgi:ABC-type transport system involved in multi-copper enzyme maturation permease subunit
MNPLLRKEIRLVLPAWGLAMVLAILPAWLFWPTPYGFIVPPPGALVFAPFALGVLLLGITPFGQEISSGMFSIFLAQPIPRARIWLIKTLVLALALATVFGALCVSNQLRLDALLETMKTTAWRSAFNRPVAPEQFLNLIVDARKTVLLDSLTIGGLSALAAFAGGLWTTLFFRQVAAALWFTFLIPMGLALLTLQALGNTPNLILYPGLLLVLGSYSAIGYGWARKMFFQAQDAQWTGGIVALPYWLGRSATVSSSPRGYRPWRTLIAKEIQANHINLLLAAGLLVLHLAVLVLRRIGGTYLADHRTLAMALESFPMLWLALPLMIGSIAVAEERKLGTMENSLCLPATRRLQFLVKLTMALILGVVLGGLVPLGLEALGRAFGLAANASGVAIDFKILSVADILWLGSAGLTLLAFYGSTLTRNTLQAMGAGLGFTILAAIVLLAAANPWELDGTYLWGSLLLGFIGGPVMILVVVWLAYANYKHLHGSSRVWLRNLRTLFLALVGVLAVTTTIYHRAWETWLSEEPTHRWYPSYLAKLPDGGQASFAVPPKLAASEFRIAAILPDGRLWLRQARALEHQVPGDPRAHVLTRQAGPWRAGFIPGTHWKDVAVTEVGVFALQTNGTLWDLSAVELPLNSDTVALQPFALGDSWESVAGGKRHVVGLKSNGTLWEWGERHTRSNQLVILEKMAAPRQVGSATDWVAICNADEMSAAIKADHTVWRWRHVADYVATYSWSNRLAEVPERWLVMPAKRAISLSLCPRAITAVCTDGTLWFGGGLPYGSATRERADFALTNMVQWGQDSDWREVNFTWWDRFIAIKQDGILCEWDPSKLPRRAGIWTNRPPTMPSLYGDWLTACRYGNAFFALAGDGTLSLWGDRNQRGYFNYRGRDSELLLPSRLKARRVIDLPVPYPSRS